MDLGDIMTVFLLGVKYHAPEKTGREIKSIFGERGDAIEAWEREQDRLREETKETKSGMPDKKEWDSERERYQKKIENLSLDSPDEELPHPKHPPSKRPFVEEWMVL